MTREDLKRIIKGITEEELKAILDINTSDIGRAKRGFSEISNENISLKSEKEALLEKLDGLLKKEEENSGFKRELEELKQELQKKEAERADRELTRMIEECFEDRVEDNQYIKRGLISDIKEELKKPENEGKSCKEIFEEFTFNKEGIFKNPNPMVEIFGMGEIKNEELTQDEFQRLGYIGKNELFRTNRDLYERLTKE